ncbi:MAG: short-chain fatty acid transporter [Myxococcales bacterium]|nr:short-chain fatty acid transporter [Myxococcales bacterium]
MGDDKERPVAEPEPTGLERAAQAFTRMAEKYVPDAFVFALIGTFLVVVAALLGTDVPAAKVVELWGKGFWELLPFTLQMVLVVVTGYVLATAPAVYRGIAWLAKIPKSAHGAVAFVAFFSMASSWLNWGFSLMFSAMLAREIARRVTSADYRSLAASSFLGLGSVWAQGLSGSAALQMTSPTAMTPAIREIVAQGDIVPGGIIPLSDTIFLWQSLASVVIEVVLVTALVWFAAPRGSRARSAADLGIDLGTSPIETASLAEKEETSGASGWGEAIERSRVLSYGFVALSLTYLVVYFRSAPTILGAVNLDTVNLTFLTAGVLLHGTPARLMRAVRDATPATWGIILQFPFYAGIASIISKTKLSASIAHAFTSISTPATYPALIAAYSAALGVFVPSGGSKWVIEAPYVMQAAHDHKVHLGWMVACYDLGEAVANLVQPFWMLPVLGLFKLKARDVMGFTFLVFIVLTPVVLVLVTVLGGTLSYPR